MRLTSAWVGRGAGSPPGCRTEGSPTSVGVERPAFRTASRSSRGRSLGERAGVGGPCPVQPNLRPVAARAISAPCGGSSGPHGWGAARRHGSQQGDGHRDPWLPEEWAQKPGLMQASLRLPKARAWLLSMLGWGSRSQCRQGTCNGCLPGHCPERASSSPKQEGWGPGPHVMELTHLGMTSQAGTFAARLSF